MSGDATRLDPPPGRYRVVEKDGLLVVVDNGAGAQLSAPAVASGTPGPVSAAGPGPIGIAGRLLDAATAFALARAVRGWDEQGRAVVAWQWTKNGRTQRWNARLDADQQLRLGRTLLSLVAVVPLALAFFLAGQPVFAIFLALPLIIRGAIRLNKLQAETSDQDS